MINGRVVPFAGRTQGAGRSLRLSLSDKHRIITSRPIYEERGKEQLLSVPDNPLRGMLFYQIIISPEPLTR